MIYHIYWGTSGNAGLYLDEIYQCLKKNGFSQRAFVNYYYPFNYGDKLFFRYGDVANSKLSGKVRKIVQLFEVLLGYIKILFCVITQKPKLINYSHAGQSYFFVYWFLRILKKISVAKVVVTCHDVIPFGDRGGEMEYRKKIFNSADILLVHNDKSIEELVSIFDVDRSVIRKHLFPIMDLTKISKNIGPFKKDVDFLFIGHLRKEKGVEFLLEVWKEFHMICPQANLKICGRKLPENQFKECDYEGDNVDFQLRFIDDDEYYQLVCSAKYVVLPYLRGTNSGIISTVLSLGTNVITSDIPMFLENPLVPKNCVFKCGDKESLKDLLTKLWQEGENYSSDKLLSNYRNQFEKEVIHVYNSLM